MPDEISATQGYLVFGDFIVYVTVYVPLPFQEVKRSNIVISEMLYFALR